MIHFQLFQSGNNGEEIIQIKGDGDSEDAEQTDVKCCAMLCVKMRCKYLVLLTESCFCKYSGTHCLVVSPRQMSC